MCQKWRGWVCDKGMEEEVEVRLEAKFGTAPAKKGVKKWFNGGYNAVKVVICERLGIR